MFVTMNMYLSFFCLSLFPLFFVTQCVWLSLPASVSYSLTLWLSLFLYLSLSTSTCLFLSFSFAPSLSVSLSSVFLLFPSCESESCSLCQTANLGDSGSCLLCSEKRLLSNPHVLFLIFFSHSLFRLPFNCALSSIANLQSFHLHGNFPSNVGSAFVCHS